MQWYGGQIGLTFNNGRNYSNSSNSTFNPSYNSSLRVNYTQPILANFKIDNQRNALRTTVIQRQMSDVALQSTIENTKSSVRTAYWALRQAIERIEIQRLSLLLAQQVVADNKMKVEIGTMAPIDQTTAEVQEAQSEQALLNAQVQWTTAELVLKRLIVGRPGRRALPQHDQPDEQSGLRAPERRHRGGDSGRDGAAHGHRPAAPEPRRQQPQPRGDEGRDQAAARPDRQLPAGRHGRLVEGPDRQLLRRAVRARHAQHADVDGRLELQLPHRHGGRPRVTTRAPRSSATRRFRRIKVTELQIATEVTNAGSGGAEHLAAVPGRAEVAPGRGEERRRRADALRRRHVEPTTTSPRRSTT